MRTCFNCQHIHVCRLRQQISETSSYMKFNIDGDEAPGKIMDVYVAIANSCLHFIKIIDE